MTPSNNVWFRKFEFNLSFSNIMLLDLNMHFILSILTLTFYPITGESLACATPQTIERPKWWDGNGILQHPIYYHFSALPPWKNENSVRCSYSWRLLANHGKKHRRRSSFVPGRPWKHYWFYVTFLWLGELWWEQLSHRPAYPRYVFASFYCFFREIWKFH